MLASLPANAGMRKLRSTSGEIIVELTETARAYSRLHREVNRLAHSATLESVLTGAVGASWRPFIAWRAYLLHAERTLREFVLRSRKSPYNFRFSMTDDGKKSQNPERMPLASQQIQ